MKNLNHIKYLYILFFFIFSTFKAQKISYIYNNNNSKLSYELLNNKINKENCWVLKINAKGDSIKSDDPNYFFFVKDNMIYANEKLIHTRKLVKDTQLMKWVKTPIKKIILGYKCNEAKTKFRGRNYTAYYTNQIHGDIGPWKFRGVKGVILFVESDDKKYSFEAVQISKLVDISVFNSANETIKQKTFISWEDYKLDYLKETEKQINSLKCNCDDDGKNIYSLSKIEKIHPTLHDTGVVY